MPDQEPPRRTYLRRRGRMTRGQHRALAELAGDRVHSVGDALPPWDEVFGRKARLGVEIGFGMGQALLEWAAREPDWNLLGIEVYQPGIGALLLGAQREELAYLRVLEGDAEQAFRSSFPPHSVDEVRIFFPDPWPKKRHHKRRLIQPAFVHLLAQCLKPDGRLLLATDWVPYAQWMLEICNAEALLANLADEDYVERSQERVVTRFESRGERLGHEVRDLAYRRR